MSNSSYSVAMARSVHDQAMEHLIRPDGQEDLCFGLWFPSRGRNRTTALLADLLLPLPGDRLLHGNASFLPQYFERAMSWAAGRGAGLAFLHSHPGPGWQGMSDDDVEAEVRHAAASYGATGHPLVGLTLGTDGAWSARFWPRVGTRRYARQWCEKVRVVGERVDVTYHDGILPPPAPRHRLARTISAWGNDAQAAIARLRVGIIGAGSVGSIVAEALARTGIREIRLFDFDTLSEVNLDRTLHATERDLGRPQAKVNVLARALRRSATARAFRIEPIEWSVCEEEGYRAALDCDVLFSCVDRPWPRSVLNFIAYAHLIPVIDGGILARRTRTGRMAGAEWRAHVVGPGRECLACNRQFDPGDVSLEREGFLDDPTYIAGLPKDHSVHRNENVFAFSLNLASFEVLEMLALFVAPGGISDNGPLTYHLALGDLERRRGARCLPSCLYPGYLAQGDTAPLVVTARHRVAAEARATRRSTRTLLQRITRRFLDFLHRLRPT